MESKQKLGIQLEVLFWIFTLLVAVGFIYPIYRTGAPYPFYYITILFIVVFVTLTRYIFLMKLTFLAHLKWVKAALILISIPFLFYLIQQLNMFQTFQDEEGLDQYFRFIPLLERIDLTKYIDRMVTFFGTASIIAAIIFPFRMMISIWRNWNKGTV